LPLYGHELSVDLNPLQTRYPWVVSSSADFIGKPVLDNYVLTPDSLVMTGLELASSIARQGYPIVGGGHVSSGTLAPYINKSVALAYLPKQSSFEGNKVIVKVRSREVSATVVKLPFYSRKRKGA
jgi:aminomethyltransferase